MIVYNVKDNFVIPFTFKDKNGLSTSVPSKFVVSLTTGNHRHFSFSQGYGEPLPSGVTIVGDVVNISIDDENLLGPGSLVASVTCALVNSSYPDGYKRWSYSQPLGIVLVRGGYESVVGGSVNGIESIHVLESLVSGGENKVTIKETNGSEVDFVIRNGVKGDKGDQGNSGVYYNLELEEEETPDFSIINNLETGGEEDALSAEMGKVLKAMTSEYTYPIIDVSVGNNTGAIVPASTGHIWSNGTSYKGRCFDVSDMRGWRLHIRHGESVSTCSFAFLNATPVNGQPISYCDGETYHSGVSEAEVIVPDDATLLYVQRLSSSGVNITPIVEILTKDKETMYSLVESVNDLKEHEFDPTTVVDTPIQAIATKSGYYLEKSGSDGLQRGDMHTGGAWRIVLFEVAVGDVVSITTSGNSTSGSPMYAAWYSEPDVEEGSEVIDSLSHDSYVNYAVLNCADSNKKNTVTVPSGAVYLALSLSTTGRTQVTKQETVNRIDLLEDKVAVLEDGGETMTLNGRLKAIEGSSSIIDTTTRKVLIFGNSYSYDAFGFLPHIIKVSNAGMALTLGVCMDGSQTLAGQLAHANNPSSYYTRYSKHSGSSWTNDYHKSFDSAVEDEDWDLIVFHQSSNLSCSLSSITPYLPQLISHLRDNGYTGKIGWLVTPAYAEGTTSGNVNKLSNVANTLDLDYTLTTDEMQHRINDVAYYLKSHYAIDVVFPCGMAIGYARHSVLDNIGEWAPADALGGNLVYIDGHHLQYGVGNLVESWVAALVLTRGRCAMADINSWGWMNGDIMSSDDKAKGMDSESQRIARECAYKAYHQFIKHDFESSHDYVLLRASDGSVWRLEVGTDGELSTTPLS